MHGLAREAVPSAPSSTIKRLRSIFEKEKARLTTAFVCHATGLACQIENKNNLDAIPTNRFIGMQWGVCCSKQGNAANLFVLSRMLRRGFPVGGGFDHIERELSEGEGTQWHRCPVCSGAAAETRLVSSPL